MGLYRNCWIDICVRNVYTDVKNMNTSNLMIDEESSDKESKVFYISRKNVRMPWPTNATLANFVSGGNYKKFKILEIGDPNVKIVKLK